MKALILSFFAVILGYSLIFNEKEESGPVMKDSNSVYVNKSDYMQISDSMIVYKDKTAALINFYPQIVVY